MLAGLFVAIGFALEGDDLGVMDETIDERDDAGGVGEDLRPVRERAVGSDQGAAGFVAAVDQFEEQIGMAVRIGQVANLVDDQERRCGVVAQSTAQSRIAIEGGEIIEKLACGQNSTVWPCRTA